VRELQVLPEQLNASITGSGGISSSGCSRLVIVRPFGPSALYFL
jgi:hypothetical protein